MSAGELSLPQARQLRSLANSEPARSLEGLNSTIQVPGADAGFWRQYRAFIGPALLVSVGYMDPGNWGTDLQAGASYRYQLLWVVGLSSLMAVNFRCCPICSRISELGPSALDRDITNTCTLAAFVPLGINVMVALSRDERTTTE